MPSNSHPIFARFYRLISEASDAQIAKHRDELLAGLSGEVVEVGCGNGLNFAHYPIEVTRVTAIEPDPYLRRVALEAAPAASVPTDVTSGSADSLDVEDASVDAVVFSLVLCSVPDQSSALSEAQRVLRPGGELRFYEHVVSPKQRFSRFQTATDRVWPHLFGGCHTARNTTDAIESAGFEDITFRRFDLKAGPIALPVSPHVLGRAVSSHP